MSKFLPIIPLGASEASANNFGVTAVALVTAAANVRGLILRSALVCVGTSTAIGCLYIGTAAPASYQDVTRLSILRSNGGVSNSFFGTLDLPPGYGIWAIAAAVGTGNHAAISYDLR